MCYEEAVMEMNIHVGDDDVGVEKSPKNERPPTKGREARELLGRELGLDLHFLSFSSK